MPKSSPNPASAPPKSPKLPESFPVGSLLPKGGTAPKSAPPKWSPNGAESVPEVPTGTSPSPLKSSTFTNSVDVPSDCDKDAPPPCVDCTAAPGDCAGSWTCSSRDSTTAPAESAGERSSSSTGGVWGDFSGESRSSGSPPPRLLTGVIWVGDRCSGCSAGELLVGSSKSRMLEGAGGRKFWIFEEHQYRALLL